MRVFSSLEAWSAAWEAATTTTVVTVGNFDGVHLAHRQLLEAAREEAAATGAVSVALSFEPHPSRILHPQTAPPLITPLEAKIRQLATTGIGAAVFLPFSRDLSLLSPLEFVEQVLVRGLKARSLHEGENFRFGHRHQGTVALLARLGEEFHFALHLHPPVKVREEVVSSSRVRELVAAGAVGQARHLLGRSFSVRGPIARGRGVGRQRTVPTLNLQHYEELLPGVGVYLTQARLGATTLDALTNVGVRPTFGPEFGNDAPLTVETHVLHPPDEGLEAALGDAIEIHFLKRLRDERRFATPEELRTQIQTDIGYAERYFESASKCGKPGHGASPRGFS